MAIRIVQLGSPRYPDEGIRFGTVRRPPRGVRKTQYAKENWYDVWLPNLSPSAELMSKTKIGEDGSGWKAFDQRFRAELKQPDKLATLVEREKNDAQDASGAIPHAQPCGIDTSLLDAMAALSHNTNFSVGCYCNDEQLCHRSILRAELKKRSALIK